MHPKVVFHFQDAFFIWKVRACERQSSQKDKTISTQKYEGKSLTGWVLKVKISCFISPIWIVWLKAGDSYGVTDRLQVNLSHFSISERLTFFILRPGSRHSILPNKVPGNHWRAELYFKYVRKNCSILSKGITSMRSYRSTWLAPGIMSSSLLSPLSFLKASSLK